MSKVMKMELDAGLSELSEQSCGDDGSSSANDDGSDELILVVGVMLTLLGVVEWGEVVEGDEVVELLEVVEGGEVVELIEINYL